MRRGHALSWEKLHACSRLTDFAPRLARAQDQLVAQRAHERHVRGVLRHRVLKAERLVAHRELQLVRAGAVGNGRYIMARQRKLQAAQRELAAFRRRLSAAERAA